MIFEPDRAGKKFGPLWFMPGITGINAATLLYGSFSTLMALSFMNFVQPYLLNEVYRIPEAEQGSLTGQLQGLQEVIVILLMGFVGAYSDKVGRRRLYSVGFAIVGLGYFIYPLADGVLQLYIFRSVFAVGAAMVPVMLSACIVDYVQEVSRGKWLGVSSFFNGLGVLTMSLVMSRLPQWYLSMGSDSAQAGRYAFWTVAALSLLSAVILGLGLQAKSAADRKVADNEPTLSKLRRGLLEARNPRLALAFGAAFIGRGDLVIVATFFSLWIVQVGRAQGVPADEATAWAGFMFGLTQIFAMVWAIFMGLIADRLNRVAALALAMGLATLGYGLIATGPDPFGDNFVYYCVALGIGETSVVIAGGALLGQESSRLAHRGAVVGLYGLIGGLGILVASLAGGEIFDAIGRTAPFGMMAMVNLALMLVSLFLLARERARQPSDRDSADAAATPPRPENPTSVNTISRQVRPDSDGT